MAPLSDIDTEEFQIHRPIKPKNWEFKIGAEHFIYCSNRNCPVAKSGIGRVHNSGPQQPLRCLYCESKFPAKPNGETWGFDHYAALIKGKKTTVLQGSGNGGNGGGNRSGAGAKGSGKGSGKAGAGGARKPGDKSPAGPARPHGPNGISKDPVILALLESQKRQEAVIAALAKAGGVNLEVEFPQMSQTRSISANQQLPAWGPKAPANASESPVVNLEENPVSLLSRYEMDDATRALLATLKVKPDFGAISSSSPQTERPERTKSTSALAPYTDKMQMANKLWDRAKKDTDEALVQLQEAQVALNDAVAEFHTCNASIEEATKARDVAVAEYAEA